MQCFHASEELCDTVCLAVALYLKDSYPDTGLSSFSSATPDKSLRWIQRSVHIAYYTVTGHYSCHPANILNLKMLLIHSIITNT
jgi:hypothetical protein